MTLTPATANEAAAIEQCFDGPETAIDFAIESNRVRTDHFNNFFVRDDLRRQANSYVLDKHVDPVKKRD
ncbi:hypothetical protein [Paraburkholderia sp. J69-2]|uniref:hypothetical protein n=1 Tax=Paraburkholderia sp. J69-2 TaxID=2805437 RepID=UPI002AAFF7CC|nr:hypothetical protein [Paraburkholderia sp. J69-2]